MTDVYIRACLECLLADYLISAHSNRSTLMTGIKDAKCVLVIGATSGIGRALALAIHDLDSKPIVIVAGRRQERLNELAAKSDRIKADRVDINTNHDKLKEFVDVVVTKYPDVIRSPVIRDPSSKLFCRWML